MIFEIKYLILWKEKNAFKSTTHMHRSSPNCKFRLINNKFIKLTLLLINVLKRLIKELKKN